jgi:dienelactone hydrolase
MHRPVLYAILVIAALCSSSEDLAAAPIRPTAADFAAEAAISDPLLSPDGHAIAAREQRGASSTLIVLNADNPAALPARFGLGNTHLGAMHWAGNRKLLLTVLSTSRIYNVEVPVFRLVSVDVVTGQSLALDTKSRGILAGDVLYVDPQGAWALVSSQDTIDSFPSVKRVDLATGVASVVEKPRDNVWDWYADSHGVVRGGLAYTDSRWKLWYREKAGEPLRALKGKIGKADSTVDRFIFSRKDGTGAIVTDAKTGRFGLYKYDFDTDSIGAPIYENPVVDIADVVSDPDTGDIQGVTYQDDRRRTHWLDPMLAKVQAQLDTAMPDAVNDIVSLTTDQGRALVLCESSSSPPVYFLLDRKAGQMHPVIDNFARIDSAALAPVVAVNYRARDGLNIPAYLTLPLGKAKALPLVVLPHGGPFERDDWSYDPLVQFIASQGYAVLQPEYRGSTGYGKSFVENGYGQWGHKMQDDLDDGVDWLARSGKVDPKRVCIMGGSYGGYAALWGAIRNPERYRCAISFAGVSDLRAQIRDNRKSFSATRYFKAWRTRIAGEGKVDLSTVSPITYAAELKVPVLIAHGEQDTTVAPAQSHAMVNALTKAHANVTSVFYKDGDHSWGNAVNFEDLLKRVKAFLAANNPA